MKSASFLSFEVSVQLKFISIIFSVQLKFLWLGLCLSWEHIPKKPNLSTYIVALPILFNGNSLEMICPTLYPCQIKLIQYKHVSTLSLINSFTSSFRSERALTWKLLLYTYIHNSFVLSMRIPRLPTFTLAYIIQL